MTTTATVRPNDPAHPTDPDGTAGSTSPARPISPARPTDPSASARPASPARLARRPRRWPRFLTITDALSPRILADPGAWVGALLRHARLPFAAASILNLLSYLVVGLIPAVLGAVVDTGLAHGLTARLLPGLAILAGLGLLGAVVGSLAEMFSMGAWACGWQPSGRGAAHRLGEHPRAVTRAMAGGDVVSTVTADADAIGELMYFISTTIASLIATLVVGALMVRMDVGLGLLVLLGVPVVLILIATLLKPLNRRMSRQREEQGRLATVTTDVVAGLRILRGIGGEAVYSARYAEASARVRDAGIKVASTQALLAAIRAGAPMILTAVVVGATASAALGGRLSAGEFVTFYGYTTFLIWPMGALADLMQFMTRAWVGAKKVARIAATAPLVDDGAVDPDARLDPGGDLVDAATGVRLRGGAMTGLVCARPGASAALAERLGRPDDGVAVTLGGTDLRRVPVAEVRRTVVVSGARAEAFAGPLAGEVLGEAVPLAPARDLKDLVALYSGPLRPDATRAPAPLTPEREADAARALRVAVAGDVVDSLGGLEGQLAEKARNLSGGQRQRVALARAVARRAPVLVLVEPTSALDSHTEALVARRLRAEREGLTTVVVTASPLLLGRCDEVVLLEAQDGAAGAGDAEKAGAGPAGGAESAEKTGASEGAGASEGTRSTAGASLREIARGTHRELSALAAYAAVVGRAGAVPEGAVREGGAA